jgi:uncharacterized protein (TIGR00645 family)
MQRRIEHFLEETIFASRWLLAPFYVGLILGLILLLVKFAQHAWHMALHILEMSESQAILDVLALIDISLAANLVLMVIFAGYENFVSKIDTGDHEDRPDWMGKVDYSGLKLKLLASIVAISAIQLLRGFIDIEKYTTEQMGWMVGIHLTFVVSGVLLAWMDKLTESTKPH